MSPIITEIIDGETWEEALTRNLVTIQMLGIFSKMSMYPIELAAETVIPIDQCVS